MGEGQPLAPKGPGPPARSGAAPEALEDLQAGEKCVFLSVECGCGLCISL